MANASLSIARELGVSLSYTATGAAAVTVYGFVTGGGITVEEIGASRKIDAVEFTIPRQTSFPPNAGISLYETIAYGDVTYSILGIDSDSLDAQFKLTCEKTTLNI